MPISKRERQLLGITITVVVVGLNVLLYSQLRGPWQKLNADLITKRRELVMVQKTIKTLAPEWRQNYKKMGQDLKQSERFESATDVIKKVDEVGGAAGILTQSKRPMKEEEHDVYHEWAVQYYFEATTEPLVKFLPAVPMARREPLLPAFYE